MQVSRLQTTLLIAPGLSWLTLLMVLPCVLIFGLSFFERGIYGGIDYIFTLENFSRAINPLYLSIFLKSARVAGLAALASLLLAYPAAYAISRAPRSYQSTLLFLAILPFWSNYLIRTYAWIVLLNREGLLNQGFEMLGYSGDPINMLYSENTVILGLVYNYIPFVILAIYASISRLDPQLWEASEDLGASMLNTFYRIILPQTAPGISAGFVFVFVLSIGNFITPDLLGGGRVQMVGNLIYDQFLTARDWPFGAALSFVLISIMMALLFAQATLTNRAQGSAHG